MGEAAAAAGLRRPARDEPGLRAERSLGRKWAAVDSRPSKTSCITLIDILYSLYFDSTKALPLLSLFLFDGMNAESHRRARSFPSSVSTQGTADRHETLPTSVHCSRPFFIFTAPQPFFIPREVQNRLLSSCLSAPLNSLSLSLRLSLRSNGRSSNSLRPRLVSHLHRLCPAPSPNFGPPFTRRVVSSVFDSRCAMLLVESTSAITHEVHWTTTQVR